MSFEGLAAELRARSSAAVAEIGRQGELRAAEILEQARVEAERRDRRRLAEREAALRRELADQLAVRRREARGVVLRTRAELLERIRAGVERRLASSARWPAGVEAEIAAALRLVPAPAEVRDRADRLEALSRLLAGRAGVRVAPLAAGESGGPIVAGAGGVPVIDLSAPERLHARWPELVVEVAHRLDSGR